MLATSIAAQPATAGETVTTTVRAAEAPVLTPDVEREIEALIRDWFALLHASPADERIAQLLPREPSFELTVAEGSERAPRELGAWIEELRSAESGAEFTIDSIRIVPESDELQRARFEVERRTRGADGAVHLVSWEQTWWVRTSAGGAASVARIEQRPVLPFPGTGPRIVCD